MDEMANKIEEIEKDGHFLKDDLLRKQHQEISEKYKEMVQYYLKIKGIALRLGNDEFLRYSKNGENVPRLSLKKASEE